MRDHVDDRAVVELTKALVAIDTQNPPGDERAAIGTCMDALAPFDAACEEFEIASGRTSLIATVGTSDGSRPTLIVNGHLDVVPVDFSGWKHDPFGGDEEDGRLYGRGTADMKGGIAAAIEALHALRRAGREPACDIVFHLVADEERGGAFGTDAMVAAGKVRGDACLVPEPTGMDLCIAERGLLVAAVTVHGTPAHGSEPRNGVSAIEMAAQAVLALHAADFGPPDHPLLGRPTCNIGVITGGSGHNTVAEQCTFQVDRRLLPGMSRDDAVAQLRARIESVPDLRYDLDVITYGEGSEQDPDHPFVALLQQAVGGGAQTIGMAFTTDARFVRNQAGIPTVVCGPGDVAQAHTFDEYVAVDALVRGVGRLRGAVRDLRRVKVRTRRVLPAARVDEVLRVRDTFVREQPVDDAAFGAAEGPVRQYLARGGDRAAARRARARHPGHDVQARGPAVLVVLLAPAARRAEEADAARRPALVGAAAAPRPPRRDVARRVGRGRARHRLPGHGAVADVHVRGGRVRHRPAHAGHLPRRRARRRGARPGARGHGRQAGPTPPAADERGGGHRPHRDRRAGAVGRRAGGQPGRGQGVRDRGGGAHRDRGRGGDARGARAYAVSLLTMAGALGAGICVMALPLADQGERAWRLLFVLPLLGLLVLRSVANHLPESRRFVRPHRNVALAGHGKRLWLLATSTFLLALFTVPAGQFQNEFLRDERGFSAARITLFTILTATPASIGIVVGGRWADIHGRRIVGAIGVVGGVGFTVLMFVSQGWPLWGFSVLASIVGGATVPALGVYGPELFPTSLRGRANGLIFGLGRVGSIVGLVVVGILSNRFGSLPPAFAVMAFGPALLAVLVIVAYPETAGKELEELNPEDSTA